MSNSNLIHTLYCIVIIYIDRFEDNEESASSCDEPYPYPAKARIIRAIIGINSCLFQIYLKEIFRIAFDLLT